MTGLHSQCPLISRPHVASQLRQGNPASDALDTPSSTHASMDIVSGSSMARHRFVFASYVVCP
ncbi:hypothetical protein BDZ89DRAFT_1070536, partial [Hymenopellis radicata]